MILWFAFEVEVEWSKEEASFKKRRTLTKNFPTPKEQAPLGTQSKNIIIVFIKEHSFTFRSITGVIRLFIAIAGPDLAFYSPVVLLVDYVYSMYFRARHDIWPRQGAQRCVRFCWREGFQKHLCWSPKGIRTRQQSFTKIQGYSQFKRYTISWEILLCD